MSANLSLKRCLFPPSQSTAGVGIWSSGTLPRPHRSAPCSDRKFARWIKFRFKVGPWEGKKNVQNTPLSRPSPAGCKVAEFPTGGTNSVFYLWFPAAVGGYSSVTFHWNLEENFKMNIFQCPVFWICFISSSHVAGRDRRRTSAKWSLLSRLWLHPKGCSMPL